MQFEEESALLSCVSGPTASLTRDSRRSKTRRCSRVELMRFRQQNRWGGGDEVSGIDRNAKVTVSFSSVGL